MWKYVNSILLSISALTPLVVHFVDANYEGTVIAQIGICALGYFAACLLLSRSIYDRIDHSLNLLLIVSAYLTLGYTVAAANGIEISHAIPVYLGMIGFRCTMHAVDRRKADEDVSMLNRYTLRILQMSVPVGFIAETMVPTAKHASAVEELMMVNSYWEEMCRSCTTADAALMKFGKSIDKKHLLRGYCDAVMRAEAQFTMVCCMHRALSRKALEAATGKPYVAEIDRPVTLAAAQAALDELAKSLNAIEKYATMYQR